MNILAQCGYSPGNKVSSGLNSGVLDGVILSPRNHDPAEIAAQASYASQSPQAKFVLLDPQTYGCTVPATVARVGKLNSYPYYPNQQGMGRIHFTPAFTRSHAAAVLDFQAKALGSTLTHYVSPTVLLSSFDDFWSQIAISMAAEAIEHAKNLSPAKPLLLSIFAGETAFSDLESVKDYLDALTAYDVDGFYIVVERGLSREECALRPLSLGHLMYAVHVLAGLNEYEVVAGYEDIEAVLLHAAGATATATGWSRGIKAFNLKNLYVQSSSSGGSSPRARYTSGPLMSTLTLAPDLRDISSAGRLSQVLTGGRFDSQLIGALAGKLSDWDRTTEALHHWATLRNLVSTVVGSKKPEERANAVLSLIQNTLACHNKVRSGTIISHPAHLLKWTKAVKGYREAAGF